MRRILAIALLSSLAACGFEGTDRERQRETVEATPAPQDPDFAEFVATDIADPGQRPIMQLQVVLDRQGFGPGVIDGGMGLSTRNALKGFQEANGLPVTGELDTATRESLGRWTDVAATRVVRIPESWGEIEFQEVPDDPADQAEMERLGYESLAEKLAERFHTSIEVLEELNPGGRPAGMEQGGEPSPGTTTASAEGVPAYPPRTRVTPTPVSTASPAATASPAEAEPMFRPGQLVRVPNIGDARIDRGSGENENWHRTLASLGVSADQPTVTRVVVDESEGWLKAYDEADKLVAMFTVTTGSHRDPLPLGEWGITGIAHNPPFSYNPELLWAVPDDDEKLQLPPGPNGPVGVVWIALTKEHYGIHGTPEPHTIGRAQSNGCVRLTNWDAARLAGMVSNSTKVLFQA
jgi:lipoprotein-anchoring transpeptidase ErfK/SrfK